MATLKQAKRALDQFEAVLSARPNVVGLGIVPASDDEHGEDMAVAVYVRKKLSRSHQATNEAVPETLSIRGRDQTITVPVRVIEQGEVRLERPRG
jgi:hypothetical protein